MGRLPSLDTLRLFSIAARHMSFTRAADELHLTQSAISHRVRALEEELGVPLFDRLPRRLELTRAGQALAQGVDQAVAEITRTIASLDLGDGARRLSVTLLPSVASRWLVPRLPSFHALHRDIELQLMADRVFPVCSPRFLAERGPVETVEALLGLPLLHDSATEGDGSGSDWRSWLNHVGW